MVRETWNDYGSIYYLVKFAEVLCYPNQVVREARHDKGSVYYLVKYAKVLINQS